ncbi:MAG: FAD-binding oxidoreductase [Fuerstiella sp.]|nr:FAD-binding oxidoreductase [Fuerstiella sp.]MCP4858804.1 FAD-binding oxidoreductase [Fuerstiella sp.]
MTHKTYDAIVIGGGIIGVSSAYQLSRRGLRVAILEKGPHVASGSTGQSSAVVRQRYANIEVVQLAYASLQMFQNWCERLELKEDRSGFSPAGVVWLSDTASADCAEAVRQFERVGAAGGVVDVNELQDRYPSLNFCDSALDMTGIAHDCRNQPTVFWEPEGGFADPQGTTEDLLQAAINKTVDLFVRHEVTRIEPAAGGGFRAVQCSNGEVFSCNALLNASGPWCQRINEMVGVTLPMNLQPTRVQIAQRDRPSDVVGEIPVFVSAADQIYARPEANGQQFIVGSVAAEDESEAVDDPDNFNADASQEFRDQMMHKLHHRFAMRSRGTVRGYAALYTVNTDDWHPIIDAVGPQGFFVANGFSGHGFKLGPSIGCLIGRMMTGVGLPDDPAVDVRYFGADRKPLTSSSGVLA